MDIPNKKIETAIRGVRKECLKAFEKAANRCLATFPEAESSAPHARMVLNLLATQAHESLDLFMRQFAVALDQSIGDAWLQSAENEISDTISELEATPV